jgi:hypothetical protein
MPITINGLTGISGADGSAATPFIRGSDADTGLYFPSAGNAAISINGSQALLVDNSNNVTMTGNLTVSGTLTVGGVAAVAVAPSTPGNVLTSNGTAWTSTAPSGGGLPAATAIGQIPFSTNGSTYTATQKITQGTSVSTATTSFTGATVGANTALTASSVTGTIAIGQVIAGTGIATGTTITAGSGTSWTISPASTGTVSGTITVVGVDFLSIPSWVKRVTVMMNGVSTSGTSAIVIQIGAGSVVTTGYNSATGATTFSGSAGMQSATGYFLISSNISAATFLYGSAVFSLMGSNTWVCLGIAWSRADTALYSSGTLALGGSLDRVRITTAGGTDTFDAGSINILYE